MRTSKALLGLGLLAALVIAPFGVATANPPVSSRPLPSQARPTPSVGRAVHMDGVSVEGMMGSRATFVVRVSNRLDRVARQGAVFVNSTRTGNPYVEFTNLRPGETRVIRVPSTYVIQGDTSPDGGSATQSFDVGIVMEPDATGENWDHVWHRVTATFRDHRFMGFTDTTFVR